MTPAKILTSGVIGPPDPQRIDDPEHWQDRADEARAKAATMGDPEAKATMARVAEAYEQLARWARERGPYPN